MNDQEAPLRFDATLRQRERAPMLGWLPAVGASVLVASYAGRASVTIAIALFLMSVFGFAVVRGLVSRARQSVRVRVSDDDVSILTLPRTTNATPERVIPRSRVASAFFRPLASGGYVVLRDASDKHLAELLVRDQAEATSLQRALDLDVSKRSFPIDVASPIGARTGRFGGAALALAVLAALVTGSLFAGISPMFALTAVTLGVLAAAWPAHVEIASDGVAIAWLTGRRFVPFSELATITETANGARLTLASGERLLLPRAVSEPGTDAMVARLREALALARDPATAATRSAVGLLARGDRDVAAWLAHLHTLRSGDYRASAIRDDDLWGVIEDPRADAGVRAAAALVLRPALDDAGRVRIRIASGATASPQLRVALETVADAVEHDADLEEPLQALTRHDS